MEKNTILAVVLSTIVVIVFFTLQNVRAVNQEQERLQAEQLAQTSQPSVIETEPMNPSDFEQTVQTAADSQIAVNQSMETELEEAAAQELRKITVNTNTLTVVLTNEGGDIISWKLNDHLDHSENVDMIFRADDGSRAFSIAFGGMDAAPVSSLFHVNEVSDLIKEFYRDFISPQGDRFRLIKRYEFKPNDYMFELSVSLEGGQNVTGFNFGGNAYTLSFGPQIGPRFERLDARYEFRQYFTHTGGRRRNAKVNTLIDERPAWAAISGKYFVFIAIPHAVAQINAIFTETAEPGIPSASRFSFIRPAINQRSNTDTYRFYLGPKSQETLNAYHTGANDFQFQMTSLTEAASSRGILAPLERLLKWLLINIVKITPQNNYGIAIILLTLLIKILFFPLTKKSSEATSRMQELAPKIKEIQEKYKGNPQKLNAEMAAFYQKEGYNPLSGCLPMLLQIPIFIAMYNLFNNHFDLRGATFIAGWIPDLSMPEHVLRFPENFRLPILGWTALRGLPFIYVASQLLYGKFTQTPGQQSQGQMKMMLYVMPIVFFFILYNMPSGLLLYWIFSNIFTLVQQIIINKYKHAKTVSQGSQSGTIGFNKPEEQKTIIAPNKKKKRRT